MTCREEIQKALEEIQNRPKDVFYSVEEGLTKLLMIIADRVDKLETATEK